MRPKDLPEPLCWCLIHAAVLSLASLFGCAEQAAESGAPGASSGEEQLLSPSGRTVEPLARNVILVSLDTLRADRLEPYGYGRPTSPNLSAIASRSVVFERARAQASQTAPSHASLFSSQYMGAHRVINVHGEHPQYHLLPPGVMTLAEILRADGIQTAGFVSGGNLSRHMGFDRGFDLWDEKFEDVSDRIDALLRWVMAPDRGRFFAVLHTYQIHAPYLPPADVYPTFVDAEYGGPLRSRLEKYLAMPAQAAWESAVGPEYWEGMLDYDESDVRFLSDLYDAEIRYVDGEIRRLLEYLLRDPELSANTAVIFLSDHGEEFKDHGKYQHDQVFEELVHVPLVIKMPPAQERAGYRGRVSLPVELIDVAPTVADLLGVSHERTNWLGRSLLPLMKTPGSTPEGWETRPTFSELVVDPGPKYYRAIAHHGWKYIHVWQRNIDMSWEFLFHLDEDPGEARNMISSMEPEAGRALRALKALLKQHTLDADEQAAALGDGGAVEMDADMERLMRQLGYIK
jgi:arylsulfatase A-like enzyme